MMGNEPGSSSSFNLSPPIIRSLFSQVMDDGKTVRNILMMVRMMMMMMDSFGAHHAVEPFLPFHLVVLLIAPTSPIIIRHLIHALD